MENVFIGLVIAFLAFVVWRLRVSSIHGQVRTEAVAIPSGVIFRPQPLLTDTDLSFYNLIRLAVEDHYLVFAKVPLWSVVSVEAEGKARSQMLRQIALKQLDLVLVHPGTKIAEKVVLFEEGLDPQPHEIAWRREVESVLRAAGITLTILKSHTSYTVPQLTQLLGVGDDE
jgi:Protein of unknown function (DUF2726)